MVTEGQGSYEKLSELSELVLVNDWTGPHCNQGAV